MAHAQGGRGWRTVATLVALAFALLVPLQSVAAGSPNGSGRVAKIVDQLAAAGDQFAAFAALPEHDQEAVKDYLTVTTYVDSAASPKAGAPGGEVSIAASGCWTWRWQRDGRNAFGALLWSYFQQINWCGKWVDNHQHAATNAMGRDVRPVLELGPYRQRDVGRRQPE